MEAAAVLLDPLHDMHKSLVRQVALGKSLPWAQGFGCMEKTMNPFSKKFEDPLSLQLLVSHGRSCPSALTYTTCLDPKRPPAVPWPWQ